MSTRATIKFIDGRDEYFVYRHHDGHPENIEADLKEVVDRFNLGDIDAELGMLPAQLIGNNHRPNQRTQSYELTTDFHGDESYRYFVFKDGEQWAFKSESAW